MRKHFTLIVATILISSITGFSQPTQPQFPNTCTSEGFAVLNPQDNSTASSLYTVSSTGTYTLVGATGVPSLNGIGMDGRLNKRYIWGMNSGTPGTTTPANLYRIGSDGSGVSWATINPPTGGVGRGVLAFAADINPNTGVYYVPALVINSVFPSITYTFYLGTFNVDDAPYGGTITPAYTPVTLGNCQSYATTFINAYASYVLNGGPEPSGLFQDLALSPNGSTLYGFMGVENVLMTLNIATATANCINADPANATNGYTGCTGTTTCEMGGLFFDPAGTLYAIQVDKGITYTVNTTTGALTPLAGSSFPADSRGDAATCATISNSTLPVNFVSFDAVANGCNTTVKWTTAQEYNNAGFEIQSSSDGSRFQSISQVAGQGDYAGQRNYSAVVSLPQGVSFIRIKQTDKDGRFTFSRIISVTTSCSAAWEQNLVVAPTLVRTESVQVRFYADRPSRMNISLYTMDGKLLQNKQQVTTPGNTVIDIPTTQLAAGMYVLRISDESGKSIARRITKD